MSFVLIRTTRKGKTEYFGPFEKRKDAKFSRDYDTSYEKGDKFRIAEMCLPWSAQFSGYLTKGYKREVRRQHAVEQAGAELA
jgi:hypothetical protein